MASFDLNYQKVQFLLFSHAYYSCSSLLSTGITKFEFEKENDMNSGNCSEMTPS